MTKEQAIQTIKEHCYFANLVPDAKKALDMAIDALEQPTSDDCVSREKVDQNIYDYAESNGLSYANMKNYILDVPPVTPTRKVGKILVNDKYRVPMYECLGCKHLVMELWKYCPNCGAKMRGAEK